ncbi:MAG: NAD(P)H-dependent oxidoreductase [Alphaproteobacteria bacterium]|nr:NAD(P)H-dependent oxidoreductase [Alphaproteobacteria bacterium]
MKNVVIIQGHPDPSENRLCRALAAAYENGARSAGHNVTVIDPAQIDFPLLRTQVDWKNGIDGTPATLREAQAQCMDADHFMMIYPLWMGTMPALLKAFLEQVFRPGVALSADESLPGPLMKGKSARVVVTMGMPALAYRWFFLAHSLKNLERNILGFSGIRPVRNTLFGMVEKADSHTTQKWFDTMNALGKAAK